MLLVNRRGGEVLGHPTYPSARAAAAAHGRTVDLAVLCVPAAASWPSVTDAVAAGARAIVAITAGLSEAGPEGARLEAEALAIARGAGAVLVGPNCLGIVDTTTGLQLAHAVLPAGDVAVLSQSGNLVLDLAGLLADRGLGVSRFVSLGNQADLGVVDLLHACVDHEGTRAVAVYTEDVVDGRAFLDAARALRDAGKPVVLLAPGRTEAAVRSAASHTGSLTSSSMVVDAACAAVGAHRVDHPTQMADLLVALRAPRRMPGRRVAILTDGGGHGAVAADALAAAGLRTPVLTGPVTDRARGGAVGAGDGHQPGRPRRRGRAGRRELRARRPDPARVRPGRRRAADRLLRRLLDRAVQPHRRRSWPRPTRWPTRWRRRASRSSCRRSTRTARPARCCAPRASRCTATSTARARCWPASSSPRRPASPRSSRSAAPPVTDTSYDAARALFADAGVEFPDAVSVTDAAGLEAALEARAGFPLVLKATGRLHKSEGGGVVVGLADRDAVRAAYADLVTRLAPPAVSVEAMADLADGVELIVGSVRDPKFGPVVMVGLGGVFTEVLGDTACAIAPVSVDAARELLLSLQGAPLLLGARGRAPVDLDALAELVARVSRLAAAHPELVELELNPVLAGPAGVLALDARVVLG